MIKDIYVIKNDLNNKVYVGQSKCPEKRYRQHCHSKESLIGKAIQKYGKEHFYYEILESAIENYNEREKFWINKFNSQTPNGYNLMPGGEEPPLKKGEKSAFCFHTENQANLVKKLLKETELSFKEIALHAGYSDKSAIDRINKGIIWKDDLEEYPLRRTFLSQESTEERWKQIYHLLKESTLTHRQIASIVGCKRSCVTMINNGKNCWHKNIKYPIRNSKNHKIGIK
jgi:group I intron endonuclease